MSKYQLKLASISAGGGPTLIQRFSSDQVRQFRSGTCTLGFWIKPPFSVTTATINLKTPAADTNFTTVTTRNESGSGYGVTGLTAEAWNYVCYSFDPSAWTNIANGMQLDVVMASSSDYYTLADFRLARGTLGSAQMIAGFVTPTLAENEERCFPFYRKTFQRNTAVSQTVDSGIGVLVCAAATTTISAAEARWDFGPIPMRIAPTVVTYGVGNTNWATSGWVDSGVYAGAAWVGAASTNSVLISSVAGGGNPVVGTVYIIHATADARL
jgi:hypothetical protein